MKGYRTYLCALGIGIAAAVHYLGVINDTLYQTIVGILTGGGLAALRASIAK